ncbi:MAG: DUF3870 domain-containing protein [Thermotaleaceae bacterium]|jgi:beta-lactamase class A
MHSVYVIGESRTNSDNAITKMYGSFYMAFEIDDVTNEVLDFSCTHTVDVTERYLSKLFLGKQFQEIDNWLERELTQRYGGSSRKAVIVSYRDALKRWQIMTGNE